MNSVRSSAGRMFVRRAAMVGLALVLAMPSAGCSGDKKPKSGGPPGTQKAPPSAQKAPPTTIQGRSVPLSIPKRRAHFELRALSRTSDKFVTGHFRVANEGPVPLEPWYYLRERGAVTDRGRGSVSSASGIGLFDGSNNKLYLPFRQAEGSGRKCLCSELNGIALAQGESIDIYAVFPAPPVEVRQVTVTMPYALPFADVPIAEGPLTPLPDQKVDPATTQLAEPRILEVTSVAEGIELSVDDEGGNRAVRLSDDVLFALNKADLTPRATGLLQQLAKQIDASTSTTIKVDGHTDTSGNDAINQPLSERRAQAVADRLKTLVTRSGVTYQTAGHGSKEPVASNSTDEGRRKNRRTTVQFARPKPPAPPASTTAPDPNNTGALKTLDLKAKDASGLKVEINSFRRDANGAVILTWTLRNTGQTSVDYSSELEENLSAHGDLPPRRDSTSGGVMLIDRTQEIRYEPAYAETGSCTCSSVGGGTGGISGHSVGPGESVSLWNLYKPSPETRAVDVRFSWGTDPKAAVVTGLPIQ